MRESKQCEMEDRAVYLGLTVWGEQFRYFLQTFLMRSFLSPKNIQACKKQSFILLIASPEEDWKAISNAPITKQLRDHMDVEWIQFTPGHGRHIQPMRIAHWQLAKHAWQNQGYICWLPPDAFVDGAFLATLKSYVDNAWPLVLGSALRANEEKLMTALGFDAAIPRVIDIKADEINRKLIQCLHSQMLVSDIDSPYYFSNAHMLHIRDEQNGWFVAKTLHWHPYLLDTKPLGGDLVDEIRDCVVDGHICSRLVSSIEDVHFIENLNTISIVSWAREDWSGFSLKPRLAQRLRVGKWLWDTYAIRRTLRLYIYGFRGQPVDWIKQYSIAEIFISFCVDQSQAKSIEAAKKRLSVMIGRAAPDYIYGHPKTSIVLLCDALDQIRRKLSYLWNVMTDKPGARRNFRSRVANLWPAQRKI